MKPWEPLQPSAISLVKAAVSAELQKLRGTARVLGQLKYAIAGLESLLSNKSRNENAIQSWLTDNPILFGPDYTSVIPKHMLGAEYEMDYALVRHSGIVDLVEIEASNLPLFNRKEDPTSYLIHAEQQVLDWLEWVETNGSYARQNLPGIYSPRALIIIGRASALTPSTIKKLKRRNLTFRGQVEILTYDDLLQRAKNILIFLSANESCA